MWSKIKLKHSLYGRKELVRHLKIVLGIVTKVNLQSTNVSSLNLYNSNLYFICDLESSSSSSNTKKGEKKTGECSRTHLTALANVHPKRPPPNPLYHHWPLNLRDTFSGTVAVYELESAYNTYLRTKVRMSFGTLYGFCLWWGHWVAADQLRLQCTAP